MSTAKLIAVDWGTTSLRLYAVDSKGAILKTFEAADGILSVPDRNFEGVLKRALGGLAIATAGVPIILSGMIGSRQGWVEAPYAQCPARTKDLAASLVHVENTDNDSISLIPGITWRSEGGAPDVIRGEETQVFGALADLGVSDGLFVLPGTHSKWISVSDNQIISFQSYMTGEIFSALKDNTILGRMMVEPATDNSFERGVTASTANGTPGHLLHQVFSTRTLGLFDELSDDESAGYLSGLLIGSEIHAGMAACNRPLHIMAGSTLSSLYVRAAKVLELETSTVKPESIVRGHCAIAEAAGI